MWDATPKEAVAHSPTYQGSHSTARRILVRRTKREKIMAELKQTVEDNVLLSAAARRLRVCLALYLVISLVALRLTRYSPHSTKTPHPGSSSLLQHCGSCAWDGHASPNEQEARKRSPTAFYAIPDVISEEWEERKNQIGIVEMCGAVLAFESMAETIRGCSVVFLVDPASAEGGFANGGSACGDRAQLIRRFSARS